MASELANLYWRRFAERQASVARGYAADKYPSSLEVLRYECAAIADSERPTALAAPPVRIHPIPHQNAADLYSKVLEVVSFRR